MAVTVLPNPMVSPLRSSKSVPDGWKTYSHPLGFSFAYPPGTRIQQAAGDGNLGLTTPTVEQINHIPLIVETPNEPNRCYAMIRALDGNTDIFAENGNVTYSISGRSSTYKFIWYQQLNSATTQGYVLFTTPTVSAANSMKESGMGISAVIAVGKSASERRVVVLVTPCRLFSDADEQMLENSSADTFVHEHYSEFLKIVQTVQ